MPIFTVHVEASSHDDLRQGNVHTHTSRVRVLADTPNDAQLIACQMVACHHMPTSSTIVDD